jgi:hypothetical protein
MAHDIRRNGRSVECEMGRVLCQLHKRASPSTEIEDHIIRGFHENLFLVIALPNSVKTTTPLSKNHLRQCDRNGSLKEKKVFWQ